jgi:hypothetical protein
MTNHHHDTFGRSGPSIGNQSRYIRPNSSLLAQIPKPNPKLSTTSELRLSFIAFAILVLRRSETEEIHPHFLETWFRYH